MMISLRIVWALLISSTILGGLALYMAGRSSGSQQLSHMSDTWATGQFRLEITLTFQAGPDPFAFDADAAPSLVVSFRDAEILRRTDTVPAGEPVLADDIAGIVAGRNGFYVKAVPLESSALLARAVRVRIFRDDAPIADETLWSSPGQPVEGEIVVDIPEFPS